MLVWVMLGAALGASSRWFVDQMVQSRHDSVFPWGTFAINVSGSLALGLLLGAAALGPADARWVAAAGTGFCGGFTTFSTFGYETLRLIEDGARLEGAINALGSLAAGLVAAFAGWGVATLIWA
jgi:CrcB protein